MEFSRLVPKRTPTNEIHKELNLNYISDRRHEHTLTQVYKCIHGLAPDKVSKKNVSKTPENTTHEMQMRSVTRDELFVPNLKLETACSSSRFRGSTWYNLLDPETRRAPSVNAFKYALKNSDLFEVM